jgi:hypothetical protein
LSTESSPWFLPPCPTAGWHTGLWSMCCLFTLLFSCSCIPWETKTGPAADFKDVQDRTAEVFMLALSPIVAGKCSLCSCPKNQAF